MHQILSKYSATHKELSLIYPIFPLLKGKFLPNFKKVIFYLKYIDNFLRA